MGQTKASPVMIVQSLRKDPYYNLALEEFLLDQILPGQVILYLWQNQSSVVIGKNQNPWRECDWEKLQNDGGTLVRRVSGGGAVYHDQGNLNFSFIMDRGLYDVEKQLGLIIAALQDLGISAAFSGRNDLEVEGRKFSGNAFYIKDHRALHHGTILIDTDLERMSKYLHPPQTKLNSRGIDSVRSRVVNLSDFKADLTVERLQEKLREKFALIYGIPADDLQMDHLKGDMEQRYKKFASWEWCFGESPDFDILFEERFSWGSVELGLGMKNGVLVKASLYSDAMDTSLLEAVSHILQETIGQQSLLKSKLDELNQSMADSLVFNDLKRWLIRKLL